VESHGHPTASNGDVCRAGPWQDAVLVGLGGGRRGCGRATFTRELVDWGRARGECVATAAGQSCFTHLAGNRLMHQLMAYGSETPSSIRYADLAVGVWPTDEVPVGTAVGLTSCRRMTRLWFPGVFLARSVADQT
jgi:hypothetical protein